MTDRGLYLIWSNERMAWWRQNRHGYETQLSNAGRWTRELALAICANGLMGSGHKMGVLTDIPVREIDAVGVCELFAARYPGKPQPWK